MEWENIRHLWDDASSPSATPSTPGLSYTGVNNEGPDKTEIENLDGVVALDSVACSTPIDCFKILLTDGFDFNKPLGSLDNILILAIKSKKLSSVRWLIKHGADPNKRAGPDTPLTVAAKYASPGMAALLIRHGAQVKGSTALNEAAARGNLEMVKCLVNHGAEVNGIVFDQYSRMDDVAKGLGGPLHAATRTTWTGPEWMGELDSQEFEEDQAGVIDFLMERGAFPKLKDTKGRTPIDWALSAGCSQEIMMLLDLKRGSAYLTPRRPMHGGSSYFT